MKASLVTYRLAFRVLERLAPSVGAQWAERLWVTLPRSAAAVRDDRPHPGVVTQLAVPSARTIAVETWGDEQRPPVYLVHGWGGWRGQLGAFIQPLLDAGYRVVAFDSPSHGQSEPSQLGSRRGMLPEFCDALEATARVYGPPVAIIAHSMGAAASALTIRDGLETSRLVLVAPFADLAGKITEFGALLGFGARVRARLILRMERLGGRPFADYDVSRVPEHADVPATLVLHDQDDKEIAVVQGKTIAHAWPGAELVRTDGLGHRRILRDPEVVSRAVAFIASAELFEDGRAEGVEVTGVS